MKDVFGKKMFRSLLLPTIAACIGLTLANIADSLVVGIHLGETGLAAIGITVPIFMIYAVFYTGFGVGGSIAFSKLMGEGKKADADKIFNMMMETSVIISLLFTVFGVLFTEQLLAVFGTVPTDGEVYEYSYDYAKILFAVAPVFFLNVPLFFFIRADGSRRISTIGFIAGNIIDVALNILLVIVLDIGITGAAWATVAGQSVSILIYITYFIRKKTIKPRLTLISLKTVAKAFVMGIYTVGQFVFQFFLILIMNRILMRISGEAAVAVMNVIVSTTSIGMMLHQAAGQTAEPLASTFFGEKNYSAQESVKKSAIKFGLIAGTLLLLVTAVCAALLCRLFGANEQIGAPAVRIYCLSCVLGGVHMILCDYYQSVGKEKLAFVITFMRGFVFPIGFAYLFSSFGADVIWWLFPAAEVLTFAVYLPIRKSRFFDAAGETVTGDKITDLLIVGKDKKADIPVERLKEFCESNNASEKQTYFVTMVVEETSMAIINNAAPNAGDIFIQITLIALDNGVFELHLRDNAPAFNPLAMRTKRLPVDTDEQLAALGILMVKEKAKSFYYRMYQGFNSLTVRI